MTKMKYFLSCILFLLISGKAIATEQSMDVMIYNDSVSFVFAKSLIESPIRGYPLEDFIWKSFADSTKREVVNEMIKGYRWCIRGYIATWEMRNDSLFLMGISYEPTVTAYVRHEPAKSFPLQRLFPDRDVTNGVFADWFSGRIFTVTHHQCYPPLEDDYWENARKTFVVAKGKLLGLRRW